MFAIMAVNSTELSLSPAVVQMYSFYVFGSFYPVIFYDNIYNIIFVILLLCLIESHLLILLRMSSWEPSNLCEHDKTDVERMMMTSDDVALPALLI